VGFLVKPILALPAEGSNEFGV